MRSEFIYIYILIKFKATSYGLIDVMHISLRSQTNNLISLEIMGGFEDIFYDLIYVRIMFWYICW